MPAAAHEEVTMPPIVDTATAVSGDAIPDLAQFEPDPDGRGSVEVTRDPAPTTAADDPQWIVWADAECESAWAASELTQIGAGTRV